MKKKVAFIAPTGEGGPKVLYRDLVSLLNEKYPEYEYFLVSSVKERTHLHFFNKKYDLIISSVPFLWKPANCHYIVEQHGLYKKERGFTSIPKLLNRLYPYNTFFAKKVIYPSEFLKKHYNSNHKNQQVILNFSLFPIVKNKAESLIDKDEINLLTITGFSFYDKARGLLDIFEKLEKININKRFNFFICGDGKYLEEIKNKLKTYKIPNNINISFLGKLDKKELWKMLKKSDIFLYSTFQDTFGISIIEAMSFGIPVMLNCYELFYELYNHEFISKNNEDFVKKFNKLIYDPVYYKRYLHKLYENLEKFDKKNIIEQWYNIIKETN